MNVDVKFDIYEHGTVNTDSVKVFISLDFQEFISIYGSELSGYDAFGNQEMQELISKLSECQDKIRAANKSA